VASPGWLKPTICGGHQRDAKAIHFGARSLTHRLSCSTRQRIDHAMMAQKAKPTNIKAAIADLPR